mmetsp:Transcript_12351/g.27498  ORF Transcript_12351/g.27498 Transcript_12351/m.27498 type:complete len:349 (+) Transcript_12351:156-1202(+)
MNGPHSLFVVSFFVICKAMYLFKLNIVTVCTLKIFSSAASSRMVRLSAGSCRPLPLMYCHIFATNWNLVSSCSIPSSFARGLLIVQSRLLFFSFSAPSSSLTLFRFLVAPRLAAVCSFLRSFPVMFFFLSFSASFFTAAPFFTSASYSSSSPTAARLSPGCSSLMVFIIADTYLVILNMCTFLRLKSSWSFASHRISLLSVGSCRSFVFMYCQRRLVTSVRGRKAEPMNSVSSSDSCTIAENPPARLGAPLDLTPLVFAAASAAASASASALIIWSYSIISSGWLMKLSSASPMTPFLSDKLHPNFSSSCVRTTLSDMAFRSPAAINSNAAVRIAESEGAELILQECR